MPMNHPATPGPRSLKQYQDFLNQQIETIDNAAEAETRRVGLLERHGARDGLVTLDRRHPVYGREIWIPHKSLHGAPYGMKVLVEITAADPPRGQIVTVLGDPEREDLAIMSIIHDFGLNPHYPEEAMSELEAFGTELTASEIQSELEAGRRDLRELFTMTIDGLDAKDLDDAISIRREGELIRLFVHIADVSHYVQVGTALDFEALQRGNSVYLVDRVLPMLPPQLSNGLCSLNPGVDRLAMTSELLFNARGERLESQIYPSLIRSDHRGDYTEIYEGTYDPAYRETVELMRELAEQLSARRHERGALTFHFPETVVTLNSEGEPIDIAAESSHFAHALIESFMIAANEAVADFCQQHKLPVIYRVHENPDPEMIAALREVLRLRGIPVKIPQKLDPKALQTVLEAIQERPEAEALNFLILRSLAKAEYHAENLGHFGLASQSYLHFTAPIRRYADLHSHRVIRRYINDRRDRSSDLRALTRPIAKHISETERNAMDAERASVDQKICEYYQDKLGEVYRATVSGLSPIAFYARMANSVEGTVLYSELPGYFQYDEQRLEAVGPGQLAIKIGDSLEMQLIRVDLQRRFLDFRPVRFLTGDLAGKNLDSQRQPGKDKLKRGRQIKEGKTQRKRKVKEHRKQRRGGIQKFRKQR